MIALVLPAALAAAALAAPDDAARARALDREATELSQRLLEDAERFARENAGAAAAAAELSDHLDPDDPRAAGPAAQALRRADEHQKALLPLRVRVALLSEQMQRYKETGALSPTAPEDARRIARQLRAPWEHKRGFDEPVEEPESLSQDLLALQRQLKKWDAVAPAPALVARRARRREALAQSAPARVPVDKAAARPALLADSGRGRPKTDPVPALLAQLGEPEPRRRALAAEELGQLRAEAALSPLRRALSDRDARVRASAALALGELGIAAAPVIEDLRRNLSDPDEEVRVDTRAALGLLTRR